MDYWHKAWICPFFRWDDRLKVVCEGGSRVTFPDQRGAKRFIEAYCANEAGGWKRCCIAAALTEYYENGGAQGHETGWKTGR